MEDDIIKEPLDKKMVFEFAGIKAQTNEIFAVRASHRNLLEKEYLNLLPYLELETDIQDNLIVIVQCSFDEENLFRAKIHLKNTRTVLRVVAKALDLLEKTRTYPMT